MLNDVCQATHPDAGCVHTEAVHSVADAKHRAGGLMYTNAAPGKCNRQEHTTQLHTTMKECRLCSDDGLHLYINTISVT